LEVQGFKSFKDKTVIHFDHAITGIVGPNGSGKSNIVDAFFWVMGEQSYKHMRGSGSEDLIFNGSTKYSPLGMAEATLVLETEVPDLENAPSGASVHDSPVKMKTKETAVTRRVYRSGEGEYFINGLPVRLKDIHELFMDTGVGAKGYSVIEQGQIGKIVNSKPEERRLLIEEAAGIAKYKARKKESLRKMEATQANLARLNDVIQEIERNLGSLERQAQKARQYKKAREELVGKELTWGRRRLKVFKQRLETLGREREAVEQELVGLRAELQIAENSIQTERVDQVDDSKRAEELQRRIQELSSELARQRSALDLSLRRQGDLASQLEALDREKTELQESVALEKERLSELGAVSDEASEVFSAAAQSASEKQELARSARSEADTARRELEAAKRELMAGISRSSDLSSRGAGLASRAESSLAQAERLAQQARQLGERLAAAREEAERATLAAGELRGRREELQQERRSQQEGVQTRERELRELERTREHAHRELTRLKSRLQSLEELAAAHEGFGDGPKRALEWARENGKELRALADGIEVTPGFEAALEGWLEGRLESLWASDPAVALEAVSYLKSEGQGRAAIELLACGEVSHARPWQELRTELERVGFECVGPLSESVRPEGKLGADAARLVSSLVDRVCVVRDLAPLARWQTSAAALGGWALVSLDGTAYDPRGTIRGGGGQSDSAASLLGRKRQIAELAVEVSASEAKHSELEERVTALRGSLEDARARLQLLQQEAQEAEVRLAGQERDVHQTARALRELESQTEQAEAEAEEMRHEAQRAASEREEVEELLRGLLEGRDGLEERIRVGEERASSTEEASRALEAELQGLKIAEASSRERAQSLKRELENGARLLAERERRLAEIHSTLERASHERDRFTGGDGELQSRIEDLTRELMDAQEALAVVKDKLERSGAKLNEALERIKRLHQEGDRKTQNSNALALEIEKASGELGHIVQNLEEKYGAGCLERAELAPIQEEMDAPVVTAEMSAEEEQLLGEEVERLRERIRRMGEVNVMAIEEFEEAQKRYQYLTGERTDLLRSIENLQEAIEHINRTSEERFKRAFEAIADRFERLFPIIFGGGQAKLSLVYPEGSRDVLDAGVDILAQPPGKKIVNIGLLSGGEKALTAVSLIFAIFMVKPSPFCLLDEVDAPLDDANIGKFNALLREMSAKSQFILITHNKKTMELNDTLYGVTMEEPGVSKMVSIEMH
jgi:chromosome segregation protein